MTDKFVSIEVIVNLHEKPEAPYPYQRKEPLGEARQKVVLPMDSVAAGALSLDKILPTLLVMAAFDFEKDQKELADKESAQK